MARNTYSADQIQVAGHEQQQEDSLTLQRCRVDTCRRRYCQLHSHLNYRDPSRSPSDHNSTSSSPAHYRCVGSPPRSNAFSPDPELYNHDLTYHVEETFPTLSTEDPVFEQLAITADIDNLLTRFCSTHATNAPLVSSHLGSAVHNVHEATLALASMEPVYYTAVIALIKFCESKEQTPSGVFGDRLTCSLYTSLVQHCHQTLQRPDKGSIDHVILAIVAMCLFDINAGRHDMLRFHRTGLAALTSKIGGYHNLGLSLAQASWADRLIATVLSQKPLYPGPNLPVSAVKPEMEPIYGLYFETTQAMYILRPDLRAACRDAGHLMDTSDVFKSNRSINRGSPKSRSRSRPSLDCYLFIRDVVEYRLVQMLANHTSYSWLEECTLLAARIVQITAASVEDVPAVTLLLSERIRNRIQTAFEEDIASENKTIHHEINDLLLWILFASALPRNMSHMHRRWLQRWLSRATDLHLGKPISRGDDPNYGWQNIQYEHEQSLEDIWSVMCQFIWCSELKLRFFEICSFISE